MCIDSRNKINYLQQRRTKINSELPKRRILLNTLTKHMSYWYFTMKLFWVRQPIGSTFKNSLTKARPSWYFRQSTQALSDQLQRLIGSQSSQSLYGVWDSRRKKEKGIRRSARRIAPRRGSTPLCRIPRREFFDFPITKNVQHNRLTTMKVNMNHDEAPLMSREIPRNFRSFMSRCCDARFYIQVFEGKRQW